MGRPETTPDRFHCADRNLNPRKGIHTPHARYEFVRDPIRPVVGMQELSWISMDFSTPNAVRSMGIWWLAGVARSSFAPIPRRRCEYSRNSRALLNCANVLP